MKPIFKKIILVVIILMAIWLVWYLFIRDTTEEKVAKALKSKNCADLKSLADELKSMWSDIAEFTEGELTVLIKGFDAVYVKHGLPSLGDADTMDRDTKITVVKKILLEVENEAQKCNS